MHCCQLIYVHPYLATLLPDILSECKDGNLFSDYVAKIFDNSMNINEFCAASWVIYTCVKVINLSINIDKYIDSIINSEDCLLIWVAYIYALKHKVDVNKIIQFTDKIIAEKREDEYWLLVYTLFVNNHVTPKTNLPEFTELHQHGVTFW